jgi:dihydrofolate reductase
MKLLNMSLVMLVAASENNVIGVDGDLPWKLSADLKRFKALTMGHHVIMGRKTHDSIGRLLPGRTTVIVTRQPDYKVDGAVVVRTVEQALAAVATDDSPFVTGGAEIYSLLMPHVTEVQLTRVHAEIEGDTFLPTINWGQWNLLESVRHPADAKNSFDYSFEVYRKN